MPPRRGPARASSFAMASSASAPLTGRDGWNTLSGSVLRMPAATDADALARLRQRGAKVIYLPPAPSAARYAPLVLDWGRQMKVRVVSGAPDGPHQGAVLWVALDYRRLGEDLGDLAQRVLAGEAPKTIPIVEQTPLQVEVDETLARKWSGYPPVVN